MAWEHGGTDFQSRFDKSTAQAEQMKEGGATGSVMDNPLMVADILIWQSTNALVLIPVVIGLVMLVRWMRGRPVFTTRIGSFWSAVVPTINFCRPSHFVTISRSNSAAKMALSCNW
jgi:hypothetical protein